MIKQMIDETKKGKPPLDNTKGMVFFFFEFYCATFYCFYLFCPRCVLVPSLVAGLRVPGHMLCPAGQLSHARHSLEFEVHI